MRKISHSRGRFGIDILGARPGFFTGVFENRGAFIARKGYFREWHTSRGAFSTYPARFCCVNLPYIFNAHSIRVF